MSEVVEKVVSRRLNEHLSDEGPLPRHRSAQRKYRSTETAILRVMSDALTAADQWRTAAVCLDVYRNRDNTECPKLQPTVGKCRLKIILKYVSPVPPYDPAVRLELRKPLTFWNEKRHTGNIHVKFVFLCFYVFK